MAGGTCRVALHGGTGSNGTKVPAGPYAASGGGGFFFTKGGSTFN
jgi:hypothetical protein